jgi:pimeloyl-ACP methyl ester carboxylesterase
MESNATTTIASGVTTGFLDVAGAGLYYEVRGSGPALMLVGCPMDAGAFAPLADLLATDHTVVTTDPRGINRSTVANRDADVHPETLAGDIARLIEHLGLGPVELFGSSGGAVTSLALTMARPDQVRTVIAHEPPLDELLAERDQLRAATEDMVATYLSGDIAGAWAKFFDQANIEMPGGDEADGEEAGAGLQAGADELFFFAHTLRPTTFWIPDVATLRAAPTRIIVGIGDSSTGQSCDRASRALAAALGIAPVQFPGGHIGFAEDPTAFEPHLRAALSAA